MLATRPRPRWRIQRSVFFSWCVSRQIGLIQEPDSALHPRRLVSDERCEALALGADEHLAVARQRDDSRSVVEDDTTAHRSVDAVGLFLAGAVVLEGVLARRVEYQKLLFEPVEPDELGLAVRSFVAAERHELVGVEHVRRRRACRLIERQVLGERFDQAVWLARESELEVKVWAGDPIKAALAPGRRYPQEPAPRVCPPCAPAGTETS